MPPIPAHHPERLNEDQVIRTALQHIGTSYIHLSHNSMSLKGKPLTHYGELQHIGAQPSAYERPQTCTMLGSSGLETPPKRDVCPVQNVADGSFSSFHRWSEKIKTVKG